MINSNKILRFYLHVTLQAHIIIEKLVLIFKHKYLLAVVVYAYNLSSGEPEEEGSGVQVHTHLEIERSFETVSQKKNKNITNT